MIWIEVKTDLPELPKACEKCRYWKQESGVHGGGCYGCIIPNGSSWRIDVPWDHPSEMSNHYRRGERHPLCPLIELVEC